MNLSPILAATGGFWGPIARPLADILAFFYSLVPNYGAAIALLTIAMMIVLTPLTIKQTRSMLVMQKLQPEMKKLQEQHKNDRQALNEAVMALYKEHNASPLGGCLPMLLPFPLFFALFRLLEGLSHTVHGKAVPEYLKSNTKMYQDIVAAHGHLNAFGMDLAKSARSVGGGFVHALPYFVLLLIMVGTQFYQQYQLVSKNPAAKSQPGQAMMMKFIPLFFGIISLGFAAGLVLYWTISNLIRVGQQWALYRYDPKVKALVIQDIKEIEAKTREIDAKEAKSSGRSRFRDMLSNAAGPAAERKGGAGKNDAKPAGGSAANRSPSAGRTNRPAPTKATGRPNPGAKGQTPQKPAATKPGAAKAAPGKGPVKPATPAKAGTGVAKAGAGATKPGTPRPAGNQNPKAAPSPAKAAAPKPAPAKQANADKTPASKTPAATGGAGAELALGAVKADDGADVVEPTTAPATVVAAPSNGANGAAADTATVADTATAADGNGSASNGDGEGADAVPSGAATPVRGRTGGGSARTVSSRRRKGR